MLLFVSLASAWQESQQQLFDRWHLARVCCRNKAVSPGSCTVMHETAPKAKINHLRCEFHCYRCCDNGGKQAAHCQQRSETQTDILVLFGCFPRTSVGMGCGPSSITATPDDLPYFNLTYHWVDTL